MSDAANTNVTTDNNGDPGLNGKNTANILQDRALPSVCLTCEKSVLEQIGFF